MLLVLIAMCTNMVLSASYLDEQETELMVCQILRKTSMYRKMNLQIKSNCLNHVKIFDDVVCLRDNYMNVRYIA
jgi:hypothetical protein